MYASMLRRLAVEDFNFRSRDGRTVDLALKVLVDAGEAKRAEEVAGRFVADHDVYEVIGPTGTATAAVARYEKALLPILSVSSATDVYSKSSTGAVGTGPGSRARAGLRNRSWRPSSSRRRARRPRAG